MKAKLIKGMLAAAVTCVAGICAAGDAAALEWRLGRYTTRNGDIVTVNIPRGKVADGAATCAYDFSKFDGKGISATIKARGFGVYRPSTCYHGFKFMASFKETSNGEMHYPGAAQLGGDFGWQTVHMIDAVSRKRLPGRLTLGIQAGWGRVDFDLSTLEFHAMPPLWPDTNSTHRCVYTPRVSALPRLRGVMLGHGLKEKDFKDLHDWGEKSSRKSRTRRFPSEARKRP